MKPLLLLCAILLSFLTSYALEEKMKCVVTGTIVDSTTDKPLEYATVSIYPKGKTIVAGGNLTDGKGNFTIDSLEPGEYKFKVEYIGYKTKVIESITLALPAGGKNTPIDIGKIKIADKTKVMKEVTVSAQKSFVENKIDKFVFNVGNDLTSSGGTATDVLQKVPQVSVDINGNVELLGNSNIKVLLNGKPSAQFDNNLAEALRVIPAAQIEKIEVITSPGAQYDAEGTGGIINIILKESKQQGFNGTINMSAGTRLESSSIYLHAQKGKFEVNVSASANGSLPGTTYSNSTRMTDSANILQTQLTQKGSGTTHFMGYRGQFGLNYEISKNDNLSFSVGFFSHGNGSTGANGQLMEYYLPNYSSVYNFRNSSSDGTFNVFDISLEYKKKFKKEGQELSLYIRPSFNSVEDNYNQNQKNSNTGTNYSGSKGNNKLNGTETYAMVDYTHPFTKDVVLNVGVKSTMISTTSTSEYYNLQTTSGNYIIDPSMEDIYHFNRDVHAAYASFSFPIKENWGFKLGVRDELTLYYKTSSTDSTISNFNTFVPSGVISRKFGKKQTLKLSYARRIQRPGFWSLNPFINAQDPLNIQQGNPQLQPEKVHNIDLSYFKNFEKGSSIMVMLYYRYSTQDQQSYVYYLPSLKIGDSTYKNVSINTEVNAGTQYVTGINISGTLKLFDEKLELRGNGMFFDKYIVSTIVQGATANSFNYRINGNITYKISKTLAAECFGNFRSQRTEIQGRFPSFSSYSIAIRKTFWDKKGSLAFTTTCPFNQYVNQATNIAGTNFSMVSQTKVPYQSFGLSFMYKFGKLEFKEMNKGDMGGGEEGQ